MPLSIALAAILAAAPADTGAARFAQLALACVHQEYPNKLSHTLASDADAQPPRVLTPSFYGCYDWHSSVHGHWLLARLTRLHPDAPYAVQARAALETSFAPTRVAGEVAYLRTDGRASFERPYGLAWLLQLTRELRTWNDPDARRWAATLAPLEAEAVKRITSWLPNLRYPIRIGEHSQTAFGLGLVWDWSVAAGDTAVQRLVRTKALQFYADDRACPLGYEPGGEDFLSPCLGEADLMRRLLPPPAYARWLTTFLPGIPRDGTTRWLPVGIVTDRRDPKLAHLDGLNLSRAWMLEGIASHLPTGDRRTAALSATAAVHAAAALPHVTGEHYEGGHWLGTFAVYLTSAAGIR